MKPLRIDKILSNMGWGTRNEIKKMMKKGLVTVEGEVLKDPAYKLIPGEKEIKVNGEQVEYQEFIYLMLNKPGGYISATEDQKESTVLELLPQKYLTYAPFPVGRLDKDTEGLLLLTNDGYLAHLLTMPKKRVPKIYYALIRGQVTESDQKAFSKGVTLEDGYTTLPAELKIIKASERSEIELTIYEGKYHQVKRMFQARGKEVTFLKRLSMGSLSLDESLKPGECRELTTEEVKGLRQSKV